ncbi:hypothetical protein EZJ58_3184 [Sodalis ligni]|uniref:Uncharacterized protein n=1 Tax=Sodalis ligni TaxID=2697027 RepID=A0A4R1NLD5_9GAMM|nr:hypothetical protein EZJ58_3184 [Sodalis ligni]
MIPKEINSRMLIFLMGYFSITFSIFIALIVLGVDVYSYYISGVLSFGWAEVFQSLKEGVVVGITLGLGIWLKEKFLKYKNR